MLGQDLCPILEDEGFEVIEADIDTLDITDAKSVSDVLSHEKPDYVVHCAAYTNVDKAEEDLQSATLINVTGTENIAKSCAKIGATLIYISTDYVFDGKAKESYTTSDKAKPINNYGLTKFQGEEAVRKFCKKHYITRTSWLYGHYGKNFVETMISLADKPELKVVDDQTGCPTWTVELANGIADLVSDEAPFGTYHICGSGQTTWYGFAKEIFKQLGLKVKLVPCKTDEFPRPAKRPKYSAMDNDGACRNWKVALKDYLALRD